MTALLSLICVFPHCTMQICAGASMIMTAACNFRGFDADDGLEQLNSVAPLKQEMAKYGPAE